MVETLLAGVLCSPAGDGCIKMTKTLLIAEDDEISRKLYSRALTEEGFRVIDVSEGSAALDVMRKEPIDILLTDVVMPGMDGIMLLERALEMQPDLRAVVMTGHSTPDKIIDVFRNHACDLLEKPFGLDELRSAIQAAADRPSECKLQVISAKPDWIEIRVPCDLRAVDPIQRFLAGVEPNLPQEAREAIGSVFRELLNNAIEHGGKCDLSQQVEVKYIRLKRAVLFSIKDPGEGFDLKAIEHAAVANPEDQPFYHMEVRQQKGLRPGGFGIMLASQAVDELIYNEKHNELIFIKYLDVAR
jgi:CheY-like chemotaxis protein/anti-sigma regulatory factor (Ser/Thr protein kinase)